MGMLEMPCTWSSDTQVTQCTRADMWDVVLSPVLGPQLCTGTRQQVLALAAFGKMSGQAGAWIQLIYYEDFCQLLQIISDCIVILSG